MRERADGAGDLADRDRLTRAHEPGAIALQFGVPQRQLQSECHRLGVDAMRAADHRRAAMLHGPECDGSGRRVEVGQQQIAGLSHL